MLNKRLPKPIVQNSIGKQLLAGFLAYCVALSCSAGSALAQAGQSQPAGQQQGQPQDQQPASPPQDSGKPKVDVPDAAGGPGMDVPYTIPKKPEGSEPPPPPPPPTPKKIEGVGDYSLKVNVPLVNVDVLVTTKNGDFIPGLTKDNFRVSEDGVPQTVSKFGVSEAPVTALLLVEFASISYIFTIQALKASYAFVNTMKKDDWVGLMYYDLRPHLLQDFTQDKRAVYGKLNELRIPGFSDTNMFDSLYDALDRLDRVEGKKYIILVTSGIDTFSRITYDKILKKVKDTKDVTIFPVGVGFILREYCDVHPGACRNAHGMGIPVGRMDYLQGDNELRTFASMTGGRSYFPRFDGELPELFGDISNDIRHQYTLSYTPTNTKLDGTYRKLKVQVVTPEGGQLKYRDQHGKEGKIEVVARDGYTARHTVD